MYLFFKKNIFHSFMFIFEMLYLIYLFILYRFTKIIKKQYVNAIIQKIYLYIFITQ
jgi:hypothetical protein